MASEVTDGLSGFTIKGLTQPSSQTLWITGAVVVGTGAAYLVYQQRLLWRHQQYLSSQNAILTEKVLRLEGELVAIKKALISNTVSSDEDIFLDATDLPDEQFHSSTTTSSGTDSFDTLQAAVNKSDELTNSGEPDNIRTAYKILLLTVEKYPDSSEAQWRFARGIYLLMSEEILQQLEGVLPDQKVLLDKAVCACQKALSINPHCGDAFKWLAIIVGSANQYMSRQDQVKNAFVIKEHIMNAVKYKPHDPLVYHMLGRWCYSVYMLTWVERKLAAAFFGEPPTATIEEALECFLKAEEISPKSSIDNNLYLGKCYIEMRDYKKALEWLRGGLALNISSRDVRISSLMDRKSMEEIEKLITQYKSYS